MPMILLPFISMASPNWTFTPAESVMLLPDAICSVPPTEIVPDAPQTNCRAPVPVVLNCRFWSKSVETVIVPELSEITCLPLTYKEPGPT